MMRADAKKNYEQILAVSHAVVAEHGAEASMRDIARRAGVGLATLLRHFPTREALFEALLRASTDELIQKARALEAASAPDEALLSWFREAVAFTHIYAGVCDLLASAHGDPDSALYASSMALRAAGERLLSRAQSAGTVRPDMNGEHLFALMASLGWLFGQPAFATVSDRLFDIVGDGMFAGPATGGSQG